ncbi:MAG: ComF family protein [Breznakibacter sp.]
MVNQQPFSFQPLLKQYGAALFSLVFPNLCLICACHLLKHEKGLCRICASRLPQTRFHELKGNAVERVFWGRVDIAHATSYMFYRKGEHAQKILYGIKYKGNRELGEEMGRLLGEALLQASWITAIGLVVPVPLHPRKQRIRGFNQSEVIVRGLSQCLNIPYSNDVLVRLSFTSTQTRKTRYERYQNMEGVFAVKNAALLEGKHVLLVDDVLTTGSTVEACVQEILKVPGTAVSVATLAFAAM